jgi:polyphosphate glucokinase
MSVLGVDIGGTSIKAALVDIHKGELCTNRYEIETPNPQPQTVIEVVASIVKHFQYHGPLGVGVPCVALEGTPRTPFAAYQIQQWVNYPAAERIQELTQCPTLLINDADAAGTAEMKFGAGQNQKGVVIILTIGTGIGSAVFNNGILVPNTEFGHLFLRHHSDVVENHVSERARRREALVPYEWGTRLNTFLDHLYRIFWPQLFILGGGVAEHNELKSLVHTHCPVIAAQLGNSAGVVGAAVGAHYHFSKG